MYSSPATDILLLGGTGEARELAGQLHADGYSVTYSVAGLTDLPELACDVISGGFSTETLGGIEGLAALIRQRRIELLLDATHPYAARISAHAIAAAGQCGIPCWQLHRPAWSAEAKGAHVSFDTLVDLQPRLASAHRPFFTLGQGLLDHAHRRAAHQHWVVRTVTDVVAPPGVTVLCQRGPFTVAEERATMQRLQIDALITKDSGGPSVVAKLRAAHELGIPVYIQARPTAMSEPERRFTHSAGLLAALTPYKASR